MIVVIASKCHTCTCTDKGISQARGVVGAGLLSVSPVNNGLLLPHLPTKLKASLTGEDWGLDKLDKLVDLNQQIDSHV